MKEGFGKRLQELRGNRTLQDVADSIGISRVAYGYYEAEKRTPDANILFSICKYYNISADYLIGLDTENAELSQMKLDYEKLKNKFDSIRSVVVE